MSKGKLPKFTLSHNDNKDRWDLTNDKTNKVVKTFETKEEATAGGVLKKAIGGEGSVKIEKENRLDGIMESIREQPWLRMVLGKEVTDVFCKIL